MKGDSTTHIYTDRGRENHDRTFRRTRLCEVCVRTTITNCEGCMYHQDRDRLEGRTDGACGGFRP